MRKCHDWEDRYPVSRKTALQPRAPEGDPETETAVYIVLFSNGLSAASGRVFSTSPFSSQPRRA